MDDCKEIKSQCTYYKHEQMKESIKTRSKHVVSYILRINPN